MERPVHIGCVWRGGGERISECKPRPLDTCPPRPPTVLAFPGLSQEEEQSNSKGLTSCILSVSHLLFDFIGPSPLGGLFVKPGASMCSIKKQTPVSENVTGIRGAFEVLSWLAVAAQQPLQKASKPLSPSQGLAPLWGASGPPTSWVTLLPGPLHTLGHLGLQM